MYKYLITSLGLLSALFFTLFKMKTKELDKLEDAYEEQNESIRVLTIKDDVSNTIKESYLERIEDIDIATKELINETKDTDDLVMSTDFIRLLNERNIQD